MDTSVAVNVLADDTVAARAAVAAAFVRMEQAAAVLTRFDPRSPVARLNHTGTLDAPPAALRAVIARALFTSDATGGDFDITVLPVLDYYLGRQRPLVLSAADRKTVESRRRLVGYQHVHMDGEGIRFLRPSMSVTLDGIAKGYVVDQGIAALRGAGIEYGLIDAGGEIRAIAGDDVNRFWNVGIVDPQHTDRIAAVVRLGNSALSTSGNYEVYFAADKRLFHIINPHTGYSPDQYSSVTVMADQAMDSDAFSVAAFSMSLPRIKASLAAMGHQWLVFSWDGSKRWRSEELPLVSGQASVL